MNILAQKLGNPLKVVSYMIEAHIIKEVENSIEFLMLRRAQTELYPGVWQMITGSILNEEKAYETVIREMKEETGLFPNKLWVVPFVNSFYSRRRNHICMVPVFASLVDKNSEVLISAEHSEFCWVDKDKAISMLAWQGQRKSVEVIYDYFMNESCFLNFEEIDLRRFRNKSPFIK